MRTRHLVVALAVAVWAAAFEQLAAQGGNPIRQQGRRGMGVQPRPDSMRPGRAAQLEADVRQRIARQMQTRLGLTDAQMTKVQEISGRYADRRQVLLDQERDVRMSIRQEVVAADSTRQAQVAALLDRMMTAQRQRVDLMEQEQRELAGVLTPMQRATYIGLAEQIRQRIEGLRQQQQGGRMGPPEDGAGPLGPGPGAGMGAGGRLGPGGRVIPRRPPPDPAPPAP
jgi:Spy/CpxP family protein refolding chaperone